MQKLIDAIVNIYDQFVFQRPRLTLAIFFLVIGTLGFFAKDIRLDASSQSLLLENDPDLRFARKVTKTYGQGDLLFVTYGKFKGALLDQSTLDNINAAKEDFEKIETVDSVLTILDVPLLQSPPVGFGDLAKGRIPSLLDATIDKELAFKELQNSPFYRDLLVSPSMKTTSLIVFLKDDKEMVNLINQRDDLLDLQADDLLSAEQSATLSDLRVKIARRQAVLNDQQSKTIRAMRAVTKKHSDKATMFLGGVSMIADDMMTFIRSDLKVFGLGMFFLIFIILGFMFRRVRFVLLPMLCCVFSVTAMVGLLSLFELEITVISSNFISLQLILTLALVIHLVVRYSEYEEVEPEDTHLEIIQYTVRSKFIPCLYASLTTIAGFLSLILSDIKPVMNFGWMMSAGILVTLMVTFVFFPSVLQFWPKSKTPKKPESKRLAFIAFLGRVTVERGNSILIATGLIIVMTLGGLSLLKVENSFIDYFKSDSEIYQGMSLIDKELGGTTPLEVILNFNNDTGSTKKLIKKKKEESAGEDDLDDFDDPFDKEEKSSEEKYWFVPYRMNLITKVHEYLDKLPETGKILSLATVQQIIKQLNEGKSADNFELAVLYEKLPEKYRSIIISPYVSFKQNEARIWVRIRDSMPDINRNKLLARINKEINQDNDLPKGRLRLAGAMVLYNNMLQSLFDSQIKTLGFVAFILFLMFLGLFRSPKLALIALAPNVLAAAAILAIMGLFQIPLDLMTITIGAITVGIAVDDTIHYIYRFRTELENGSTYKEAALKSHSTIGHAMYYTSVTIILGFSILAFSNFWPTIYFGLFTGLAMFLALLAALTLLPKLIILIKPFQTTDTE